MDALIYCCDRHFMQREYTFTGRQIFLTDGKVDNEKLFRMFKYIFEFYWQKEPEYIKSHLSKDTFEAFRIQNLLDEVVYPEDVKTIDDRIAFIVSEMYGEKIYE